MEVWGMIVPRLIFFVHMILCFVLFTCSVSLSAETAKQELSPVAIGELAQNHVQANEIVRAEDVLKKGIERYPDSDWLRSIYGRLLFAEGNLEEAEDQFQQALAINKENSVAKLLIKEVRLTKNLLKDQEKEVLFAFLKDKSGDLLVVFLGVWLGTMLTSMLEWAANRLKSNKFAQALSREDWDTVTDIIENQIVNWDKQALRRNIRSWLKVMSTSEIEDIIKCYVDNQQHEGDLLFFLRKFQEKR